MIRFFLIASSLTTILACGGQTATCPTEAVVGSGAPCGGKPYACIGVLCRGTRVECYCVDGTWACPSLSLLAHL